MMLHDLGDVLLDSVKTEERLEKLGYAKRSIRQYEVWVRAYDALKNGERDYWRG